MNDTNVNTTIYIYKHKYTRGHSNYAYHYWYDVTELTSHFLTYACPVCPILRVIIFDKQRTRVIHEIKKRIAKNTNG